VGAELAATAEEVLTTALTGLLAAFTRVLLAGAWLADARLTGAKLTCAAAELLGPTLA